MSRAKVGVPHLGEIAGFFTPGFTPTPKFHRNDPEFSLVFELDPESAQI